MAGLPWIVVFVIMAMVARWRGWGLIYTISLLCVGAFAAQTVIGSSLLSGVQATTAAAWSAVLTMVNSVAR
jgi:hypothetical protein